MSRKEVPRTGLVQAALTGRITNREGARALHLSIRQFQRLKGRARDGGVGALRASESGPAVGPAAAGGGQPAGADAAARPLRGVQRYRPPADQALLLGCRYWRVVARDNTIRLGHRLIAVPPGAHHRIVRRAAGRRRARTAGRSIRVVFYDGRLIAQQPAPADFTLGPSPYLARRARPGRRRRSRRARLQAARAEPRRRAAASASRGALALGQDQDDPTPTMARATPAHCATAHALDAAEPEEEQREEREWWPAVSVEDRRGACGRGRGRSRAGRCVNPRSTSRAGTRVAVGSHEHVRSRPWIRQDASTAMSAMATEARGR